ncbi:MAG: pilus assembly protein PilM [Tepidisphaeraceae bacterium]
MLGLVQNWFGPRVNPIGVDFGTDCLRLAQVQWVETDWRLIAAASAEVPANIRRDEPARWNFFAQSMRDLLISGKFHGRTVMLGLPAAGMFIQHLRLAKMDDAEFARALPWEARGKIPLDPAQAVLRHLMAGEVYVDQEPRNEVILLAAHKKTVEQLLAASAKARLDVVGMNVEPTAILDCFTQVYRRSSDAEITNFFVDIGAAGTRAVITRGREILFARVVNIGGDQFTAAVAEQFAFSASEARALRITMAAPQPVADRNAITQAPPADESDSPRKRMEEAMAPLIAKLVEELDLCRRYYEATFPARPADRLVFIGGESRHRWLCQRVAQGLGLAAQLGDPLCRMSKRCDAGIESGIDRRQPQPSWAVAIGLSMGSPSDEQLAAAAERGAAYSRSTNERA